MESYIYKGCECYIRDPLLALEYFYKVLESNDPELLFKLALTYTKLRLDNTLVIEVLLKAGELGKSEAYLYIGNIYYYTYNNIPESTKYLKKSAELGNGYAYYVLGALSSNFEEQLDYFHRSARLGNKYAYEQLGNAYSNDIRKAKFYYEQAIILGNNNCLEKYKLLITDEDLAKLVKVKKCYIKVKTEVDYYVMHESYKPEGYLHNLIKEQYYNKQAENIKKNEK